MSREAMKLALEALVQWEDEAPHAWSKADENAVAALRKALAEPEQEPVAYCTLEQLAALKLTVPSSDKIALYTAPTPRKPLSDEQIALIVGECAASAYQHDDFSFARAIERAHGIGEQT